MFLGKKALKRTVIVVMTAFGLSVTPVLPVSAELINNDQVVSESTVANARATVDTFMQREDVREQFESLGVDPDEAKKRVEALSDKEVATLADRIESAPAGQGFVAPLIGALVLIFLVLLITDLLGFTSVFGFTKKGSARPG